MNKLAQQLKHKVLILDGPMSSYIDRYNLRPYDYVKNRFENHKADLFGFKEVLNLTEQDLIKEIHEKYLKAGADIIQTNTLKANEYYLQQYELGGLAYEINFTSAKLAHELATKYTMIRRTKPRFVFGAVTDVQQQLDIESAQLFYSQQFKGLLAGKIDAVIFDSFVSKQNLFLALEVLNSILQKRNKKIAVVLTAITQTDELFFSPELINAVKEQMPSIEILAIGQHRSDYSPSQNFDLSLRLKDSTELPLIVYPNFGVKSDEFSIAQFGSLVKKYIDGKVASIISGCCGTTPDYIELVAQIVKQSN